MNEKLKEFVLEYELKNAQPKPFGGGEVYFVGTIEPEKLDFAQAVAAFVVELIVPENPWDKYRKTQIDEWAGFEDAIIKMKEKAKALGVNVEAK